MLTRPGAIARIAARFGLDRLEGAADAVAQGSNQARARGGWLVQSVNAISLGVALAKSAGLGW
jgi:hypothetical protein